MCDDVIVLHQIKKDWYNQGNDFVNIHIYVKEVDEVEILFEVKNVTISFFTRNVKFLKDHNCGKKKPKRFSYTFNTRYEINVEESNYKVKQSFIELIIKKVVYKQWESLEPQQNVNSKKNKDDIPSDKRTPPKKGHQQLLGGKSTPLSKKGYDDGKQDTVVHAETNNLPSTSNTSSNVDKRNIQKNVSVSQPEHYAGLTGLENYANNCYMNVVIQLLANIQELRDYLKSDLYVKDINTNNPLCSGGKVVKAFAELVKVLWSHRKHAFKPSDLKNIMGKRCSLFLGWHQHDAQEFFASLLDNLHEDLNQHQHHLTEKPSEREKPRQENSTEGSDNERPETAWNSHIKRNNSFIVKLFHGQLMSKVTCNACRKVSYSYDPCAQISLPIPSAKQTVQVLFFTRDVASPPLLLKLQISTANAKMWHLVNMLQTLTKVPAHLMGLFNGQSDVCNNFHTSSLSGLLKHKFIIAGEISAKDENDTISMPVFQNLLHTRTISQCDFCMRSQDDLQGKLKRCTRCMAVAYCSRDCQTRHWSLNHSKMCCKDLKMQVGLPFFVTFRKDITYDKLEEILRERAVISTEAMDNNVGETEGGEAVDTSSAKELENKSKCCSHPPNLKYIIKTTTKMNYNDETSVEVIPKNFSIDVITKSPCLIIEWQNSPDEDKNQCEIRTRKIPAHEEFQGDCFGVTSSNDQISLYDCLNLFMEPERLDETESWKCPKCVSLQSAKKEMAISSPPWLLLLHLKRFTYGDSGQKIHKAITYPINGLDLTSYVSKETRNKIEHPLIYDLCGVITHRGNMRMGHYTCMVRLMNHLDQEEVGWRNFDDDCVTKIKNEKVVSPDAYVLMYRVRGAQNAVKLDRFTTLSNASMASTQDNSSSSKRKNGDSSTSKGDRKSASENTLGVNLKRSSSVDNSNEVGNRKTSDSDLFVSPSTMRRCTSALAADNSTRKNDYLAQQASMASLSMPNVATATVNTINNIETKEFNKDGSEVFGSDESLGECFESLTLNDNMKEETVDVLYTREEESIDLESIDISLLNENDLD